MIHADQAQKIVDGSGVRVGLLIGGLNIDNPDLMRQGKSVVADYTDFGGSA